MHIELTSCFVGQDEIAFPAVGAMPFAKAFRAEQRAKARHLRVGQRDVEVGVRSRLPSKQGVYGPAAIDVHFQAVPLDECNNVGGVFFNHSRKCTNVFNEQAA